MTPDDLRALLKQARQTRAQLAAGLGMSRVTVQNWTSGKHPISPQAERAILCYFNQCDELVKA